MALIAILLCQFIWFIVFYSKPKGNDTDLIIDAIKSSKLEEIEARNREIDSLKVFIIKLGGKLDGNNKEVTNITNVYETEKSNVKNLPIDSIVRNLSKWVSEDASNK